MYKVGCIVYPDIDIFFTEKQAFILRYYNFGMYNHTKSCSSAFDYIVSYDDYIRMSDKNRMLNISYKSRIKRLWKKVVR